MTAGGPRGFPNSLAYHLLRPLLWLGRRAFYRVRVVGAENLPAKGPALLVASHLSFVDGLIILASAGRFVRFLECPSLESLDEARKALEAGSLVCVFPEGEIGHTSQMITFLEAAENILERFPVPVIPTHLDPMWGNMFGFSGDCLFRKWPRKIPCPVTVSFGKPLVPGAPLDEVRQAVEELSSEAFHFRKKDQCPLPWGFVRYARRHPFAQAMVDSMGRRASYGKLVAGVVHISRILARVLKDEEMAGLLLPPSVAGAAANLAASLLGKPVVNLNYTSSRDSIRSALEQCHIRTVITSRVFLEKLKIEVPAKVVCLEDLRRSVGWPSKAIDAAAAWLLPKPFLRWWIGGKKIGMDDLATVIFSSGSTGEPKGVMQTHFNIFSNIQSVTRILEMGPKDCILGVLPFFHSTGYTGGLWSPLLTGMTAVYHPNPLDARTVGELVKRHRVTIIFATPTFIQHYARRCEPSDFGSVIYTIVGAEKLTAPVAELYRQRFGITPLEGYGCTEASPMVAVNLPDSRGGKGFKGKAGTVGHPLPGVSVLVVDPETGERLPPGKEGLLLVKGPNVMKGYLGKPELTREVLREGWYRTGDIALVDADGFITITDRLSRFSKIAGEMVPHLKVEEALHRALDISEQAFCVISFPDPEKGEKLAVVHTCPEERLKELFERLPREGLPNLWTPRRDAFVRVAELPRLGTGKIDLARVRKMAEEALLLAHK